MPCAEAASPHPSPAPAGRLFRVDLADRSYDIHFGPGLLARALPLVADVVRPSRAFVITHPALQRLHGAALLGPAAFPLDVLLVPPGERQKSLRRASRLYDQLLAGNADRRSVVIAFGGGVIGDLAGFVAATFMRGLPYVQVPTTLLAQVDSSVGGKVAVDHPGAKNLIGAFHQPRLVVADSGVLRTLPARDYRAGLAEVVKHAVIADSDLFLWLQRTVAPLSRRDPAAVAHVVRRSCEIKAHVVRRDERETGLRAVLNLGHTVGHALEAVTGYRALRHGEAVSIGLVAASRLARDRGLLPPGPAEELERLLAAFRLPTRVPQCPLPALLAAMRADKKAAAGVPRFVLPRAIGRVDIGVEVPEHAVANVLLALGATP